MKRLSFIASLAGLAMLITPLSLLADDDEEKRPALVDVWFVVPKQGMEAQFEEAAAAHMAYRAEKEDSRSWQTFVPVLGHNMNQYQFRACCFDWADQDAYEAESEENGYGANWNENVHQYVDHYHHYIERFDYENSHWPDDAGPWDYFGVTTWTWKEDAGPGPSEARKKFSQVAISEGWAGEEHMWLWGSRVGGKPILYIVSPFADYADMAPPEVTFYEFMSDKMDKEEVDKLFSVFGSGFSSSDYTVWKHHKGLSAEDEEDDD